MSTNAIVKANGAAVGYEPTRDDAVAIEKALVGGDLSELKPEQRVVFYNRVCESVGLNPLTKPFEYILLNNKLTLYAKKDCTDQLRKIHGVSVVEQTDERIDDVYKVRVKVVDKHGRTDYGTGAVTMVYPKQYKTFKGEWKDHPRAGQTMTGDDLANVLMKCETKAKRRATLSLCGLGFTDQTEVETIPEDRVGAIASDGFPTLICQEEGCQSAIEPYEIDGKKNDIGQLIAKSRRLFDGDNLCGRCLVKRIRARAEAESVNQLEAGHAEDPLEINSADEAVLLSPQLKFK